MLVTLNMTVSVGVCMGRASKTQQKRDLVAFLEKKTSRQAKFFVVWLGRSILKPVQNLGALTVWNVVVRNNLNNGGNTSALLYRK